MNMSCSFSTSMKSNCSFSSVLKTNSSFSTVLKTHTYFIPWTPPFESIFGGGAECPLPVLSQTRILAPPPYRIDFAKNRKKSESTQNGLKRREIEKKIATWWPPRKKNLFWKFFKSCSESSETWKKLENFFSSFFSIINEKNLTKFSKFFFWKFFEFFESCSELSETWKKLEK